VFALARSPNRFFVHDRAGSFTREKCDPNGTRAQSTGGSDPAALHDSAGSAARRRLDDGLFDPKALQPKRALDVHLEDMVKCPAR
jgi:hypothetical protein